MKAYVYILECADNTYYTGYTVDLKNRIKLHNEKKASKYTRSRTPVKLIYTKEFENKNEAMSAEYHIKKLSRKKKELLINGILKIENIK